MKKRLLTILIVVLAICLAIPYRWPQGPIYDGCVDISVSVPWYEQDVCTEEYLEEMALGMDEIEYCREDGAWAWCYGYKKSALQRLLEGVVE